MAQIGNVRVGQVVSLPRVGLISSAKTRLFADRPEDSVRLRLVTLAAVVLAAASLWWVGHFWVVPPAACGLACVGHWLSWRRRRSRSVVVAVLLAVALLGLAVVAKGDVVAGLTADRLTVARYLLLMVGIVSFGMKTRGGLYSQLLLVGLVIYLASERAFSPTFIVFLTGFLGLLLSFVAVAFLEDGIKGATVHWPERQWGRVGYWTGGVSGGLLACSVLAFSLLPSDCGASGMTLRAAIVPYTGDAAAAGSLALRESVVQTTPFASGNPTSLPSSVEGAARAAGDMANGPSFDQTSRAGTGAEGAGALASGTAAQVESTSGSTIAGGLEDSGDVADPQDTVLRVRSRVSSYWRGRVYGLFDGQIWFKLAPQIGKTAVSSHTSYYRQDYFIEQDQPGAWFAGYDAARFLPDGVGEAGGLVAGSTYAVVSGLRPASIESLRSDSIGRAEGVFTRLPGQHEHLKRLAHQIVGDASNAFDRMWRIAGYLRKNHTFDAASEDQLQLMQSVDQFLVDGTPGNSLEFATASVLLARAAGLPARLAVGYLPGRIDALTGTHRVRARDAHAWAEVKFAQNGWVPFDATPRPEIEMFRSGQDGGLFGAVEGLETHLGGGLYRALKSGGSETAEKLAGLVSPGVPVLPAAAILGAVIAGVAMFWATRRYRAGDRQTWPYTRLRGRQRREILMAYRKAERALRRNGVERRRPSQSLEDYLVWAAPQFGDRYGDLAWLTRAARAAAYDPVMPDSSVPVEASERLDRMRRR